MLKAFITVALLLACQAVADAQAAAPRQLFVEVEDKVKLEVLDWGGSGRPVVLLARLGIDARSFDGDPRAHVVRIANASHSVFKPNEAEVLCEINQFAGGLQ